MVPTIEDLHGCQSDQERAAWLLSAPFAVLLHDLEAIRAVLRACGFMAGLAYLDQEFFFLNRSRRVGATFEPMGIRAARGRMRCIALGGPDA